MHREEITPPKTPHHFLLRKEGGSRTFERTLTSVFHYNNLFKLPLPGIYMPHLTESDLVAMINEGIDESTSVQFRGRVMVNALEKDGSEKVNVLLYGAAHLTLSQGENKALQLSNELETFNYTAHPRGRAQLLPFGEGENRIQIPLHATYEDKLLVLSLCGCTDIKY